MFHLLSITETNVLQVTLGSGLEIPVNNEMYLHYHRLS